MADRVLNMGEVCGGHVGMRDPYIHTYMHAYIHFMYTYTLCIQAADRVLNMGEVCGGHVGTRGQRNQEI